MLAYLFIAVAALFRAPHGSFHFTPVAAALLFFGAKMPRKQAWIPVALFTAIDIMLNRAYGYGATTETLIVAGWYAAIVLFGSFALKTPSVLRVGGAALTSSVSFFLVSNFSVWANWNMYPKSFDGLVACYVAALPFFRNTLISDLLFSAAFFGVPALVVMFSNKHAAESVKA